MSTKKPNTIGKYSAITFICILPAFPILIFTCNFISEKYVKAYFYTGSAVLFLFLMSAYIWEQRRRKKLTNFKTHEEAVEFEKADKKAAKLANEIGTFAVAALMSMTIIVVAIMFLSDFIGMRYAGILCYITIALTIIAISVKLIVAYRRKNKMKDAQNCNHKNDN